jgi:hypothetical protein
MRQRCMHQCTYLCGPVARNFHNRAVGVLCVRADAQRSVFLGLLSLFQHTYWAGARASFGFKSCAWASAYSYIISAFRNPLFVFLSSSLRLVEPFFISRSNTPSMAKTHKPFWERAVHSNEVQLRAAPSCYPLRSTRSRLNDVRNLLKPETGLHCTSIRYPISTFHHILWLYHGQHCPGGIP